MEAVNKFFYWSSSWVTAKVYASYNKSFTVVDMPPTFAKSESKRGLTSGTDLHIIPSLEEELLLMASEKVRKSCPTSQ